MPELAWKLKPPWVPPGVALAPAENILDAFPGIYEKRIMYSSNMGFNC